MARYRIVVDRMIRQHWIVDADDEEEAIDEVSLGSEGHVVQEITDPDDGQSWTVVSSNLEPKQH